MDEQRFTDRRDFLRLLCASTASLTLLHSGVRAFSAGSPEIGKRRLVILELTGGNDGLNTLIPFEDDRYYRLRPTLAVPRSQVHRLRDGLGFAPSLPRLAGLFHEGKLTIVQSVGIDPPDRSHFTSLDRWHTGRIEISQRSGGWLARGLADLEAPSSGAPRAIALGDRAMPLLLRGFGPAALACETLDEMLPEKAVARVLHSRKLAEVEALFHGADADLVLAARSLQEALRRIRRLERAKTLNSTLGRKLADVLRILQSGLPVPAFFVRMGGFDTHARQAAVHPALLDEVDRSLAAFQKELRKAGLADEVLTMVYSEFGRRVAENGSAGTDHGAAAPLFFLGGGLPGGLHGPSPDLHDLLDGDPRPTCDFRRPLAQCLKHLRHPDPRRILGEPGRPLF